jgi:plasmid segregation protein ParM
MNKNILSVGVDMGNDAYKILGPSKQELFILNLIAPWHERRIISEDTRYPLNLLEVDITCGDKKLGRYFVGGMAYNFNRGILRERTVGDRHNGKTNDEGTMIMLLTSIALSLLKPNMKVIKEKIVLGTMLPTEEYFKDCKENANILKSKLIGTHRVKFLNPVYHGVEIEFEILGVNVQPEGLCAINSILYDDNNELLLEYAEKYSEHTILGLDVGALTSDVTVLQNFELRSFFGIDKGTIDPLNRIIDYIKTEYKVTVPRHKIDNSIISNEKLLIYGAEIPNFSTTCKEMIDYEGRLLCDEFSSKAAASGIQLPDIGLLILNGGGSLLFKESIKKHLGRIPMIFSEKALMANAIGAWKNANTLNNTTHEDSVLDYVAVTK